MGLDIQMSREAAYTQRQINHNHLQLMKSQEKLASGFRINTAADNAAGLQISENLRSKYRGNTKALGNAQDGLNMLNGIDGILEQMNTAMQRMREIAVQAANGTYNTAHRSAMNAEFTALRAEIDRLSSAAEFNGVKLLNASAPATLVLQIGSDAVSGDQLNIGSVISTVDSSAGSLNIAANDVTTASNASDALTAMDAAFTVLNTRRGQVGAFANRIEGVIDSLGIELENLAASESAVRNTDIAAEGSNSARLGILNQAATSVLSQTNTNQRKALELLSQGAAFASNY